MPRFRLHQNLNFLFHGQGLFSTKTFPKTIPNHGQVQPDAGDGAADGPRGEARGRHHQDCLPVHQHAQEKPAQQAVF